MRLRHLQALVAVLLCSLAGCAVGFRGAPSAITTHGAVLNGGVASTTPGAVNYSFELGPMGGALQPRTGHFLTFDQPGTAPVSEEVEGLEPGRSYQYRICADFCSRTREFTTDEPLGKDYAIGSFVGNGVRFIVDATSDPGGANPEGDIVADQGRLGQLRGEVTCLKVSGNRATVGATFPPGVGSGFFFLEDGPDGWRAAPLASGQDVSDCSAVPPSPLDPVTSGSITVHDE